MESAIFGLIGVVLGAILTGAKDWWFQQQKNHKDAEYLAIQISCELEQYATRCADVVGDDGLFMGQTDEHGFHSPQVSPPKFEPMKFDVEWKSLPASLMYEILDFPYMAEIADQVISACFDNAWPPDFDEGFEERQYQYAILGIKANCLAAKLRNHVGLTAREPSGWDPVSYMEEQKTSIESLRSERTR